MNVTNVLVTGSEGFIGRNLISVLERRPGVILDCYDVSSPAGSLERGVNNASVIFHLAGVNRPPDESEFVKGNADLTKRIVDLARRSSNPPVIVLASSIQAALDNPYGRSKKMAEDAVAMYGENGGCGVIYRLHNVFGKWSRPNYNTVVATFCHAIARDQEISISDPNRTLELVYIDDVVRSFISLLDRTPSKGVQRPGVGPVYSITLGRLAETIRAFHAVRTELRVPDLESPFTRALYATYLSFLDEHSFAYELQKKTDQRGVLAELLKSKHFGQIFISRTHPGVTRGNHYHHTKIEKFCVLEGEAEITFRKFSDKTILRYPVKGEDMRVVDIPPGYTHAIRNTGAGDLVTLFWSSEVFNPEEPDTYPLTVEENQSPETKTKS